MLTFQENRLVEASRVEIDILNYKTILVFYFFVTTVHGVPYVSNSTCSIFLMDTGYHPYIPDQECQLVGLEPTIFLEIFFD